MTSLFFHGPAEEEERVTSYSQQNLSRVLKIAHPVTLYLDCGSEQSVRNDTAAKYSISSQRTISQRQNWANTTPFNFEVLRGANNHPPFLPARLSGSGRTQNESLCVDNGCENADFAR